MLNQCKSNGLKSSHSHQPMSFVVGLFIFVLITINVKIVQSSLEIEVIAGVNSPTKSPTVKQITNDDDHDDDQDDDDEDVDKKKQQFLNLLEEGFNVYQKLKIPGLAVADDLLYEYSDKDGDNIFLFPDFPDIPEITSSGNKDIDNAIEKDDDNDDQDNENNGNNSGKSFLLKKNRLKNGQDGVEITTNEQNTRGEQNRNYNYDLTQGHKESDHFVKYYDKNGIIKSIEKPLPVPAPFLSHRINITAEQVPKIMNVVTRDSNNQGQHREKPKVTFLPFGGRLGSEPKLGSNKKLSSNYQTSDLRNLTPWNSMELWSGQGRQVRRPNARSFPDRSKSNSRQTTTTRKSRPSEHSDDSTKKVSDLLSEDESDYRRIVVPNLNEIGVETKDNGIESNKDESDFFVEHLFSLRPYRHRSKRQAPNYLSRFYRGHPLSLPLNSLEALYQRLLFQQSIINRSHLQSHSHPPLPPLLYVEEEFFIPEGLASLPSSPVLSRPVPSRVKSLYNFNGYGNRPQTFRPSARFLGRSKHQPIIHKPGFDEPGRIRNIYMNYLDQPSHRSPIIDHMPFVFRHDHKSRPNDFEQAMRLIPSSTDIDLDTMFSFVRPTAMSLSPTMNGPETLDPISLSQYRELVHNLHTEVGLGKPSIMSAEIDATELIPSMAHQAASLIPMSAHEHVKPNPKRNKSTKAKGPMSWLLGKSRSRSRSLGKRNDFKSYENYINRLSMLAQNSTTANSDIVLRTTAESDFTKPSNVTQNNTSSTVKNS